MEDIAYAVNEGMTADEFIAVLNASSLGKRRPVDDRVCVEGMVEHANLTVTARKNGKLVGVARTVTDFHFCAYMSDLAVDAALQRTGIGRELIRRTRAELGPKCALLLLAAAAAVDYYPRLGFARHHNEAWFMTSQMELK